MENAIENKIKFFDQYSGQNIFRYSDYEESGYHKRTHQKYSETEYAELTPLSLISDEDAIEVIKRSGYVNFKSADVNINGFWINYINSKRKYVYFYQLDSDSIDFIRSKGYAYKFNGLSIDELVNRNWIKLKQ